MRKRRKQGKHMYNQQIQSKAADFEHQSLKVQTDYQNSFVYSIKITTFLKTIWISLISICIISKHPCVIWQSTVGHTSVTVHHYSWVIWNSKAGHTSITLHSSSVDQLAEHSGRTSVTLHSSPVDQLAEHSCSHFDYSPLIIRGSVGRAQWSHFCYSELITRESVGRAQLVSLRLLSTHHPWISW